MRTFTKCIMIALFLASFQVQAQRQMENLDRGLVAIKVANGVFLSWRILGTDLATTGFNIYRGTTKVNASPITGASNLNDAGGTTGSTYSVRPVINGVEQAVGSSATVWASQSLTVNLQRPAGGTNASGAYTYSPCDASVGDVDGDGQYEIILKWDPSNSKDNSQSGYTGNVYLDAYKLNGTRLWRIDLGVNIRAGAHYTQFLVGDYDSDGKAEVACKTAPGTKDGSGAFLSKGPAANDNDATDYRNGTGYILTGPEYVTIFNGQTGKEMGTLNYTPARGTVSGWGDGYGNRVDRFLATNAYLDGKKPSMVFQRGYYTRMAITAYDWNGTTFTQRWAFDSNNSGNSAAAGNGNHNLACADVDNDGFDEIIEGACAIDHDGKLMYSTKLGHGDAMHIGDMDLNNPGLEVWEVHEDIGSAYQYELHDAKTGKILWGGKYTSDNGRGIAADIDASSPGYEMWSAASNVMTSKGVQLSASKPSMNFRVYWDGDLQDELLDGVKLDKWNGNGTSRLITLPGTSCNGTKATPNLCADILGDWREEVITHDGASKLYISSTTIPTTTRMYTLMHDPVYRDEVSLQNAAYNQPPHLGFFLGNGVIPKPNIVLVGGAPVANVAPVVSLTAPIAGTSLIAPATIAIAATATDADGTIAKVDFYNGTTLISSDATAPYTATITGAAVGTYNITAVATDNKDATTTSSAVVLMVKAPNVAPIVSLTSPIAGTKLIAPATIAIAATATDADGTIIKVDFYNGTTLISSDATAPYTATITGAAVGTISLTAVATDNSGATTTSSAVVVTVKAPNVAPTVSLTSPITGTTLIAPATIAIAATATDVDGTIAKVDFYKGTTLISSDATAPYTAIITATTVGTISLTAVATDNSGATTTSTAIAVTVKAPNVAPNVSLTSPIVGTTLTAPATIAIAATATDVDGTIAKVDFYNGTTLISSTTTAPYTATIANAVAGTYSITAKATDNSGAVTTSVAVSVTVNNPVISTIIIQENGIGFNSYDGTIDNNNAGFTGTGFTNSNNALNAGITWQVCVPTTGTYTLVWKYANGTTVDRTGKVLVDGVSAVASLSFPGTSAWTTWSNSVATTVTLTAGTRLIRLQANTANGLANIDYISITGINPTAGTCSTIKLDVTNEEIALIESSSSQIAATIAPQSQKLIATVAPNPVSSTATVSISEGTISTVTVAQINGTVVLVPTTIVSETSASLNVSVLASGIYVLKVTNTENKSAVVHIIKQ